METKAAKPVTVNGSHNETIPAVGNVPPNKSVDANSNMDAFQNHQKTGYISDTERTGAHELSCLAKVFSWRYVMVILLHLSFAVGVIVRNCMPIAVVCMSTVKSSEHRENDTYVEHLTGNITGNVGSVDEVKEFDWDTELQGLIISSGAFLGLLAPMISNFLIPHLGHKTTLGAMTVYATVLLFITPIAARTSPWLLIAVRTLIGAYVGANVPVIGDFVAWWGPADERQTMISISFTGMQTGTIMTSIVSGYLCSIPWDNGWPFIFYVIGIFTLIWVLAWQLLSASKPENHKYVSEKEIDYITANRVIRQAETKEDSKAIPYKTILTSPAVITFNVLASLTTFAAAVFFLCTPIYLASALGLSASETGLMMMILSFARFFGMSFWTAVINRLNGMNRFSLSTVMKIVMIFGHTGCVASQLGIVFQEGDHKWEVVGFLCALMLFQGSSAVIIPAGPQHIAPRYAGFITAMNFSFGNLFTMLAPLILTAMTPNGTSEEWRYVWIMMAAVWFSILVIYLLFADLSTQPWAQEDLTLDKEVDLAAAFDPMETYLSISLNSTPVTSGTNRKQNPFHFDATGNRPTIFTMENVSMFSSGENDTGTKSALEKQTILSELGSSPSSDKKASPMKPSNGSIGAVNEGFEPSDLREQGKTVVTRF